MNSGAISVARTSTRLNPRMTFIYVSGAGDDSTEHGRMMWARVKGKTENALLQMPFKAVYMFLLIISSCSTGFAQRQSCIGCFTR